jgi:predicted metal-dependent hydrolase
MKRMMRMLNWGWRIGRQKLVDRMLDLLGIQFQMECMHWDNIGRINKVEIIVPEDTRDEYLEDLFDSIKIQQILDALLEEMMEKMRQRLAARPKARKIKFVLDTGKHVPQIKKAFNC